MLGRRVRTGCGEIDIIARAPGQALIAFIEVKARVRFAEAAYALSGSQRRRLIAAAEIVLQRNPLWSSCGLRFDLVLLDGTGSMRRLADVFRIGDP